MIVAIIALVAALGGTSYAAFSLPKNSVGTKQLKKNAVTTPKIKNHAVTAGKINPAGLTVPNASALSGLPASAFMRSNGVSASGVASSSYIDNFTSTSFTPIASRSFTAPTTGVALIYATLSTEADNTLGGVGHLFYTLSLDGTRLESNNYAHEISTDTSNSVEGGSGAITDVVPVTAGTHSVALLAKESANGDFIESRQISVLFVPNGSPAAVPSVRTARAAQNLNK